MTVSLSHDLESEVRKRVADGAASSVEDFVEQAVRRALESDETAYLLSSKMNADRLLGSLARSRRGEGSVMTTDELADDAGTWIR